MGIYIGESIERMLPGVTLEHAREILIKAGFRFFGESPTSIIFRRPGTAWHPPLKLFLSKTDTGVYLKLSFVGLGSWLFYDSWIDRFAEELIQQLKPLG